jgi:hypothetical protein
MITQLPTVKHRLSLLDTDPTYDPLLTTAIAALTSRFDKETNRTLARTENATDEFDAADTELSVRCYPIETVTKFELKTTESEGWQEITPAPAFLIRKTCVISLHSPLFSSLRTPHSALRISYTGGFVLPGADPVPPALPLPADVEFAAVEQVAFWFMHREKLGIKTNWPKDGVYQQFATQDLLQSVPSWRNTAAGPSKSFFGGG